MCAENTTLCCSLNNSPHNDTLNKELSKINTWLACNKFSLNIDKPINDYPVRIRISLFRRKQRHNLYIYSKKSIAYMYLKINTHINNALIHDVCPVVGTLLRQIRMSLAHVI